MNLVKCLQKDFVKEVFVKEHDFAKEVSVKEDSSEMIGLAHNRKKTGLNFVKLLSQINCVAKQREEECSESESEEYFSD